jgi:hypothetical protein
MTSVYPGYNKVNLKQATESIVFNAVKEVFKNTHISKRIFDNDTKVWSFIGLAGKEVYDALKDSPFIRHKMLSFECVENLIEQAQARNIKRPVKSTWSAQDFFYQQAAPVSTVLSKEAIAEKLAALLRLTPTELNSAERSSLKKVYRTAALEYHPDRNNGDGVRMTELNYLWQQYQPYLGAQAQKEQKNENA